MPKSKIEFPEFHAQVGARIRELRIKRGLSSEDFAKRAEMSTQSLAHYERGTRSPSLHACHRMCVVLGIDIYDLFKGIPQR